MQSEEFVKEAGWHCDETFFTGKSVSSGNLRKLKIRELQVIRNGRNQAKEARMKIHASKDTEWLFPERLTDGDTRASFIASADPIPKKQRYLPVIIDLQLDFPQAAPLEKMILLDDSRAPAVSVSVRNAEEEELEPASVQRNGDRLILTYSGRYTERQLKIRITSGHLIHRIDLESDPAFAKELEHKLFSILPPYRAGTLLGKTPANLDLDSFRKFYQRYNRNFLGFDIGEWDSNFFQFKNNSSLAHRISYCDFFSTRQPADRQEAAEMFRNLFAVHQDVCDGHFMPHAGALHTQQYACEFGATASNIQNSTEQELFDHRINTIFGRSAARQYSVPWGTYLAYHVGPYIPGDSRGRGGTVGLCWGSSPAYTLRYFLYCYYMGALFQQFESQNGMITRLPDGRYALTDNGKAVKSMYEWAKKPEAARGSAYTPMLMLLDYHHGYIDSFRRGRGIFYCLPFEDGDYMTEHHFAAFSDCRNHSFSRPPYEANLVNSPLGDLCDTYFANPPSGTVTAPELGRYAVVILSGTIRITPELVASLMKYAADGGTLILNSAQLDAFRNHHDFLGIIPGSSWKSVRRTDCLEFQATTAEVISRTAAGQPLITTNRWGHGRVLVTIPRYMINTVNPREPLPLITSLLRILADEVSPVLVRGDVLHLFNRMPDGSWKVILINNKGVEKQPQSSRDVIHPEYAAKVSLTLKQPSEQLIVRDLRLGQPITRNGNTLSLTVPAGGVCVVHLQGLPSVPSSRPDQIGSPSYVQSHAQVRRPARPHFTPEKNPFHLQYHQNPGFFLEYQFSSLKDAKKLTDSSGQNNHGTIHGGELVTEDSCRFLRLNGRNTYGDIPLSQNKPFHSGTIELWFRPRQTAAVSEMVNFLSAPSCFLQNELGKWHLLFFSGPGSYIVKSAYETKIEFGKWQHVVLTWTSFSVRLYVDGKEIYTPDGRTEVSGPFFPPAAVGCSPHLYLGTHYFNPGRQGNADADYGYLRILGRPLSPEKIARRSKFFHQQKKEETK